MFYTFLSTQLPAELISCIDEFKADFRPQYDQVVAELDYDFLDSDDDSGFETCDDE